MKILIITKLYFHKNKAGGEAYLHHFLKLLQKGVDVSIEVLIPDSEEMKKLEFDGININETTELFNDDLLSYCQNADLVITHLDFAFETVNYCLEINKPVIMIFHNSIEQYNPFIENENVIKIFNSNFVKKDYLNRGLVPVNSHLIYPYVDFQKYSKFKKHTKKRQYITLINPSENKGADVVLRLAQNNKNRKFLIVEGGYYPHQQSYYINKFSSLPNCHVIENTSTIIKDVYSKSRIVMMPSIYESYGMVAAEASCMGIPIIVNDNSEGLKENLGKLCLGGYDKEIESYQHIIDSLDISQNYHIWSNYYYDVAEERFNEIQKQMNHFILSHFVPNNNN